MAYVQFQDTEIDDIPLNCKVSNYRFYINHDLGDDLIVRQNTNNLPSNIRVQFFMNNPTSDVTFVLRLYTFYDQTGLDSYLVKK